jgi:hypothetical protein
MCVCEQDHYIDRVLEKVAGQRGRETGTSGLPVAGGRRARRPPSSMSKYKADISAHPEPLLTRTSEQIVCLIACVPWGLWGVQMMIVPTASGRAKKKNTIWDV